MQLSFKYQLAIYEDFKETSEEDKFSNLREYDIVDFTEIMVEVMVECFADCKTVEILGLTYSEYLLAFLYENWDIDRAMPLDIVSALRIGTVLKKNYNITKALTDEQKDEIRNYIDLYKTNGFIYQVEIDMYLERINKLLLDFQEYEFCSEYIIQYLKECNIEVDIEKFQTIYTSTKSPNSTKDYGVIYKLLELWREEARRTTRNGKSTTE